MATSNQGPATAEFALVRTLERHSALAWPAPDVIPLDGWELRFTPGSRSRRVNSLTAMEPVPGRFPETLARARGLCAERGLPCTVRLTPLAGTEPEAFLRAAGHDTARDATAVMVAPVGKCGAAEDVVITAQVTPEWIDGMAASGAETDERALIGRLVRAVGMQQAFATVFRHGEPVAFGRAASDGDWAGIFHIATRPESRRQGHGRVLVSALLAWAGARGATNAYLQVVAANDPAVALYRAFGFREAYRYFYVTLGA